MHQALLWDPSWLPGALSPTLTHHATLPPCLASQTGHRAWTPSLGRNHCPSLCPRTGAADTPPLPAAAGTWSWPHISPPWPMCGKIEGKNWQKGGKNCRGRRLQTSWWWGLLRDGWRPEPKSSFSRGGPEGGIKTAGTMATDLQSLQGPLWEKQAMRRKDQRGPPTPSQCGWGGLPPREPWFGERLLVATAPDLRTEGG